MYLSYSAILKNHQLNWLGEVPSDDDVEVIVTILPKNKQTQQTAVPNQWAFVKNLTPFDPTMEQAIAELKSLPPQERDWSSFE